MKPAEIARRMLELFCGDANRWTKNHSGRTSKRGRPVAPLSPDAKCWCFEGAAIRVTGGAGRDYDRLLSAARDVVGETLVYEWNDKRSRTFPEVVAVLEKIAEGA